MRELSRRFLGILPAILLAFVTFDTARERIIDVDVGWIVASGRRVLAEHAAPTYDTFSFVAHGHAWIMHEWLLGPLYALGWQMMGPAVFALVGIGASVLLGWLLLTVLRSRVPPVAAAIWASLLFRFAFDRVCNARPIGLSIVLACGMVVLAFRPKLERIAIVLVIAMMVLWTNVHGSFPLGIVILAFACVDSEPREPGRVRVSKSHLVALGGATLATLVNPYGLRLHELVARYALGHDPAILGVRSRVLEFSPIWRSGYHVVVGRIELAMLVPLFALAIVVALGLDLVRGHQPKLPRRGRGAALLAILLCTLALLQARNVPLALLAGTLGLAPHLGARLGRAPIVVRRFEEGAIPALAVGLVVLGMTARARRVEDWIDPSIGGAPFVHLVHELPDHARVFVPFRSGGLLLLLAAERGVTTFYDSRNDCYPPEIVSTALSLKDGELPPEGLTPLLLRYGTTHAIVPSAALVKRTMGDRRWPALGVLEPALHEGFRPVRDDEGWLLLERSHESPTP